MNTFKDHWRKFNRKGEFVKKRHEGLGATMAAQARFVPKAHQTEHRNQKALGLMRKNNGRAVLNKFELDQIQNEFKVKYSSTTPKKLGNTGIVLRFDPSIGHAVLEK